MKDDEPINLGHCHYCGKPATKTGEAESTCDRCPVVAPIRAFHLGRNTPCGCGSGKKFKMCCIDSVPIPEQKILVAQ